MADRKKFTPGAYKVRNTSKRPVIRNVVTFPPAKREKNAKPKTSAVDVEVTTRRQLLQLTACRALEIDGPTKTTAA